MISLVVFIGFLVTSILWLYKHLTRNFDYWNKLNIPFVKPIPLFGNIYEVCIFRLALGDFFRNIHNSVESACLGFFIFDQPFLLIRDTDLVKQILIKDFDYFDDRSVTVNEHDEISANIMFMIKNPAWRAIRTKLTPVFTSGKMKRMLPLIVEVSEELKGFINENAIQHKATEVRKMCLKYTTDVISSCAFGINAHSFQDENSPFRIAAKRTFDCNIWRSISTSAYFIAPILVKALRLNFVDTVTGNFFHKVFWKHMNEREISKSPRGDLIDILIELRKTGGVNYLENKVLLAQAVQFLLAGYETTGTTLTFTLYCLAKHRTIQHKLRSDIKEVLNQHGSLTYEALFNMRFLNSVICETLRMFPVLPYLDRRCCKPYQLPGTNITIEKGIPVYISLLGLHFDPKNFTDPHKFDPDRFKDENKADILTGTYMPFGEGPRNCIGSRFALMALKVAVVQILSEFEIETCTTTHEPLKFDPKGFLLFPTDGTLDLHFKKYSGATN